MAKVTPQQAFNNLNRLNSNVLFWACSHFQISTFIPFEKTYIYVEKANNMETRKKNSKLFPKVFFLS